MLIWSNILQSLERGEGCVLVSVCHSKGSVPRDSGARMLVGQDEAIRGSVGGGALEWEAFRNAKKMLLAGSKSRLEVQSFPLGPSLGQCCGGHVKLSFEKFDTADLEECQKYSQLESSGGFATVIPLDAIAIDQRQTMSLERRGCYSGLQDGKLFEVFAEERKHIAIFGAGHVGKALVFSLACLPVSVTWIDNRKSQFPRQVPLNITKICPSDPVGQVTDLASGTFAIVLTHDHALDYQIVKASLARSSISWVGLIGSKTKNTRFMRKLKSDGLEQELSDRFQCPVGIPGISGKIPEIIAASITARLLQKFEENGYSLPQVDGQSRTDSIDISSGIIDEEAGF
ncbi:MAG: xanthine dehydrogenase accessory protein XdhC [Cohaesibacteraceae bacterium]|nr:xanthine dehydrogenase accessory protein XdhC [Cohaesibacteraceae bacterium]